jgi:hypothetical protein
LNVVEAPANSSRTEVRKDRSILLLSLAGILVIAGTYIAALMWSSIVTHDPAHRNWGTWGAGIFVPLSMMVVAGVLGAAAIFRYRAQPANAAPRGSFIAWMVFTAMLVLHAGIAILYLRQGPGALIDTFTFQRDASGSLLHGVDPFGSSQANIFDAFHTPLFYGPGMVVDGRVQVGFQYPPITLLWVLPGYLLGDVRFSYILAIVVSAFFAFLICPNARGLWVVAAMIFSPVTYLVEYLCWTEPLVLMTLSICTYAAIRKKWWLPIALGLFLSTKQYNFLALPLIGLLIRPFTWKAYWKLVAQSLGIAVLTVLPFAAWNFRGLWHDLVLFHLAQPFRQDAVSFAVPFVWMLKVGPVLLAAFIAWAVRTVRPAPVTFAAAYGVSLLLFVSTNKQAFTNYYFLIGHVLLLAVAAVPIIAKDAAQAPA